MIILTEKELRNLRESENNVSFVSAVRQGMVTAGIQIYKYI